MILTKGSYVIDRSGRAYLVVEADWYEAQLRIQKSPTKVAIGYHWTIGGVRYYDSPMDVDIVTVPQFNDEFILSR